MKAYSHSLPIVVALPMHLHKIVCRLDIPSLTIYSDVDSKQSPYIPPIHHQHDCQFPAWHHKKHTMSFIMSRVMNAVTAAIVLLLLVQVLTLLRLPTGFPTSGFLPSSAWPLSRFVPAKDWSRFAYVQYATDEVHLCNSILIFEALHRLGTRPDRVLMHPSSFLVEEGDSSFEAHLLRKARDEYNVKLVPIENHDNSMSVYRCPLPFSLQIAD